MAIKNGYLRIGLIRIVLRDKRQTIAVLPINRAKESIVNGEYGRHTCYNCGSEYHYYNKCLLLSHP